MDVIPHFPYERTICIVYLNEKPRQVCRILPVLLVSTIRQVLPLRNSAEKIHFNYVVIFLYIVAVFCHVIKYYVMICCAVFLLYYLCVSHDVRLYSNHIYLNGGSFKHFFYFSCMFSVFILSIFLKLFISINQWALRIKRTEELQ